MRLHIKTSVLIFLFLLSARLAAQSERVLFLRSQFDFVWQGTNRFKLVCLIAKDRENRQKVENVRYSLRPDTVYEKDGNRYAEFIMDGLVKPDKLEIITELIVYPHDFNSVKKSKNKTANTGSLEKYIASEQYMESDDEVIQKTASGLKKKDDLKTVENIYKFVIKTLNCNEYNPDAIGAKQALIDKKGDCTEYTDLFVTLCRACSIPAKHIHGYISGPVNVPQHSWAEVFLDKLGWVQFEVTPGNDGKLEEAIRGYITMTDIRNDKNLNNGYFYLYYWWGASPTIKNTVTVKEYIRGR
ncbi:MAG: transglutaminase-like domain-containing protein [Prevotella sp.]|jgi:hypothetical protein|nr:transglutaminase-like domain-containing protein [Prevotella sp.]